MTSAASPTHERDLLSVVRATVPSCLLLQPWLVGKRVLDVSFCSAASALVTEVASAVCIAARPGMSAPAEAIEPGTYAPPGPLGRESGQPQERLPGSDAAIGRVCFEGAALPFADHVFDVVFARIEGTLLRATEAFLAQARRTLVADGLCVVVMPDAGAADGFWELHELFSRHFARVAVLGQSPFQGCYVSYLEPAVAAEQLALRDELLGEPHAISDLILIGSMGSLPRLEPYALVSMPAVPGVSGVATQSPPEQLAELQRALEQQNARREALQEQLATKQRELTRLKLAGDGEQLAFELGESKQANERLLGQVEQLNEQLAITQADVGRLARRNDGFQELLRDAESARDELLARAERAEQAIYELTLERDRLDVRRASLQSTTGDLEFQIAQLQTERAELQRRYREEKLAREATERHLARECLQLDDLRQQLVERQQHEQSFGRQREALRAQLSDQEERGQSLFRERERLQMQVLDLEQRASLLAQEQADSRETLRELTALRNEYQTLRTSRERLGDEHDDLLLERRELLVALRELRQVRGDLEQQLEQARSALSRLEREGAERVLALQGRLDGQTAQIKRLNDKLEEQRDRLEEATELRRLLVRARAEREATQVRLDEQTTLVDELSTNLFDAQQAKRQDEANLKLARGNQELSGAKIARLSEKLEGAEDELAQARLRIEAVEKRAQIARAAALLGRASAFESWQAQATLQDELSDAQRGQSDDQRIWQHRLATLEATQAEQLGEMAQQLADQGRAYELELEVRADEIGFALEQIEQLEKQLWLSSDEVSRQAAFVEAAHAAVENERRGASATQSEELEKAREQHEDLQKAVERSEAQRRELLRRLEGSENQAVQLRAEREQSAALRARLERATSILEQQRQALEQLRAAKRELEGKHESRVGTLTRELEGVRDQLIQARHHLGKDQVPALEVEIRLGSSTPQETAPSQIPARVASDRKSDSTTLPGEADGKGPERSALVERSSAAAPTESEKQ